MEQLFNVVKRGYDQDEVDNYIQTLETLIKSYKDKDDTIKNAIINAQISADNIIRNAEIEAERIKKRAVSLLDEIQLTVDGQKAIVRAFQEDYNKLVSKYLQNIGSAEVDKVLGKLVELEQYVESMNKIHDTSGMHITPGSTGDGAPKLVAGIPNVKQSPDQSSVNVNVSKSSVEIEDDTVALVAELLARDKSK